jgi:hypothetical protein
VAGGARMQVDLMSFKNTRSGSGTAVNMHGKSLKVKFSEGSIVSFSLP